MIRVPFTAARHLAAAVRAVADALDRHGVVALPTETFYGLAVRPDDEIAVARVLALKGRPVEKALLVVAASLDQLAPWVSLDAAWRERLKAVWPAPVTVVLPRRGGAGGTLAVRVPAHPLLRALLARVGPLTATSANRSGEAPCTGPDDVVAALGAGLAVLLDGGRTAGGSATTLLDLTAAAPRLLRAGGWNAPPEWGVKVG